jgi:hypothetical protein
MKHERIGFQGGIVFVTDRLGKFEFFFIVLKSGSRCRSTIWLCLFGIDAYSEIEIKVRGYELIVMICYLKRDVC